MEQKGAPASIQPLPCHTEEPPEPPSSWSCTWVQHNHTHRRPAPARRAQAWHQAANLLSRRRTQFTPLRLLCAAPTSAHTHTVSPTFLSGLTHQDQAEPRGVVGYLDESHLSHMYWSFCYLSSVTCGPAGSHRALSL